MKSDGYNKNLNTSDNDPRGHANYICIYKQVSTNIQK